ncbi:MAG TPA: VWA domain-containing protein [Polyangiaceae bacterium]|nr:VWA domain-containing protein [Polyangiaceae bacterium]
MSFVASAALAIALLVAAPIIAHLLRRGRARELSFPPARLVPAARSVARQRARLEDRVLFALRAAAVLLFALLGAMPLVRCSRLSLERATGASVALALVLDDSLSMRTELPDGTKRWERARRAALELLASARRGDAVAIVLAGRPARIALSPTTDLDAARRALAELHESDRSTDLELGVQMARTLLRDLPQRDRQLAVFSDFAGTPPAAGEPAVWAPVAELTTVGENCGVVSAERGGSSVSARVACTSAAAASGRKLELLALDPSAAGARSSEALGALPLLSRSGVQTVAVPAPSNKEVLGVRISGRDRLERDDLAAVGRESSSLEVAVNADASRGAVTTGGPSLVEQALAALGGDIAVRPLSVLPDQYEQLTRYSALILDDPGGLGPEQRSALTAWVTRGGVVAALLGRRAENAVIGATLEPFAQAALPWETSQIKGLAPSSLEWLGPEAGGLSDLSPHGRVRLEGAAGGDARVLARWEDGAPFLLERELGRGVLLSFGLPSSADESDFALRPGFLALLDHVLSLAREHSGQRRGLPGTAFRFPAATRVEVFAPGGASLPHELEGSADRRTQVFTADLAGRYRVRSSDGEEERLVSLDPEEILSAPRIAQTARAAEPLGGRRREVDASPEVARVLIALLGLEVLLRLVRHFRRSKPVGAGVEPTIEAGSRA